MERVGKEKGGGIGESVMRWAAWDMLSIIDDGDQADEEVRWNLVHGRSSI